MAALLKAHISNSFTIGNAASRKRREVKWLFSLSSGHSNACNIVSANDVAGHNPETWAALPCATTFSKALEKLVRKHCMPTSVARSTRDDRPPSTRYLPEPAASWGSTARLRKIKVGPARPRQIQAVGITGPRSWGFQVHPETPLFRTASPLIWLRPWAMLRSGVPRRRVRAPPGRVFRAMFPLACLMLWGSDFWNWSSNSGKNGRAMSRCPKCFSPAASLSPVKNVSLPLPLLLSGS